MLPDRPLFRRVGFFLAPGLQALANVRELALDGVGGFHHLAEDQLGHIVESLLQSALARQFYRVLKFIDAHTG